LALGIFELVEVAMSNVDAAAVKHGRGGMDAEPTAQGPGTFGGRQWPASAGGASGTPAVRTIRMDGSRATRGAPDNGDHVLAALDAFGVPYAVYDCYCRRSYVSSTALELVDAEARASDLWRQAADLARAALTAPPPRGGARGSNVAKPVPAGSSSYSLTVRVRRGGPTDVWVVVVLHPRPARALTEADLAAMGFTARECDVARLIAAGCATKEIAAALAISCHTARHHTERVFAKLGVRSRAAVAAVLSRRMGASSHGSSSLVAAS
jgi:DNA-binding CsgD family transcriptional regulator